MGTSYMDTFVPDWEPLQSTMHFERLSKNLRDARVFASKTESAPRQSFSALVKLLPNAFRKIATSDDVALQGALHPYVFEVMWALVELAVEVLDKQVEYTKPVDLLSLSKLLEALSVIFDSSSHFYKLRGENNKREITVCSWRLDSVLQVPGFFVKVFGATDGQIHYFCAKRGMKHVGEGCECCRPPPEADGVLVNLTWLLARAYGFDHILRMLSLGRGNSLLTIDLLLRPLVHFLEYNVGSTSLRRLMDSTIVGFSTRVKNPFENMCFHVCSELCHYLDEIVREKKFSPCQNFGTENADQWTFPDVLRHVHLITCWGVKYYDGKLDFKSVRDMSCKLQEKIWERMLEARRFSMACSNIGAAIEASLVPSFGSSMLSLDWLKEKKIVSELLNVRYEMKNVPNVIDFVKVLAKKKEFVMVEQDFIAVMKNVGTSSTNPHLTDVDDLIVATMLEFFDLSKYTFDFFDFALNWLENCKIESIISGPRVFHVLRKLFVYDKDKKWEKRFLNLLRKHAIDIPEDELLDCFNYIVDHYMSNSEIKSLKKTLPTSEELSKLLQDCNDADIIPSIVGDDSGALNYTKLQGQITKSWEELEANKLLLTSSNLINILATGFPFTRQEAASECLERLSLAQQLTRGLSMDRFNTLASTMRSALIPEFQTLESLQKESIQHCKAFRQVQELSENHVREYECMTQEHHERVVKFFQACRKEKEDVMWKALYHKAKVMARVKKAMIGRDVKLSSADMLARMLHKAEGVFKEVGNKHKESLERVPNNECTVCIMEFSLKRKRACLDPCGHASACVDCATQEWKRSKSCPLCKTNIKEPIALPHKLYF